MTDKTFKPLAPTHFHSTADYNHTRYFSRKIPVGTTVEHVMRPTWWRHYAGQLKPFDTVELVTTDHSLHVLLMVVSVGIGFVKMRGVANYIESGTAVVADTPVPADDTNIFVEHCPGGRPAHKWRVMNGPEIIAKGFDAKAEATKYANDYLAKIGLPPLKEAA